MQDKPVIKKKKTWVFRISGGNNKNALVGARHCRALTKTTQSPREPKTFLLVFLWVIFFVNVLPLAADANRQTVNPPAAYPGIEIIGTTLKEDQKLLRIDFLLTNPVTIKYLGVSIRNAQTQLNSIEQDFSPSNFVEISIANLVPGTAYEVIVRAKDASRNPLIIQMENRQGGFTPTDVKAVYEFIYDSGAAQAGIQVLSIRPVYESTPPSLLLTLWKSGLDDVVTYDIWLEDAQTQLRLPNDFRFAAFPGDELTLPLDGVSSGLYNIVINAKGNDGEVMAFTKSQEVLFKPPGTPITEKIAGNPLILGFISVCVLALFFLLYRSINPKEQEKFVVRAVSQSMAFRKPKGNLLSKEDKSVHRLGREQRKQLQQHKKQRETRTPVANTGSLVIRNAPGHYKDRHVYIKHTPFTIGRANQDLTIGLDMISTNHAVITYEMNKFYIADQNSRNGTYLNGQRIHDNKHELRPGAIILLGKSIVLEFNMMS